MELWIRSQDKEVLILASHLDIYPVDKNVYAIEESGVDLGNYKSKERALEVLDEIQKYKDKLEKSIFLEMIESNFVSSTFIMPKE